MKKLVFLVVSLLFTGIGFAAKVIPFSSPENSMAAVEHFIGNAKSNIYVASYTFTSEEIAQMLAKANDKGMDIIVVVEKSPVGGRNDTVLCWLKDKNVPVYLADTPGYMHAKYMAADGALISTENFGYDGFGGSNRGWGAIVYDEKITKELKELFVSDLMLSEPLLCTDRKTSKARQPTEEIYPKQMKQKELTVYTNQSAELLIGPENMLKPILDLINTTESSLLVQQFYIHRYWNRKEKTENPLLEALMRKAEQGVGVKLILDSTWYNIDKEDISSNYFTMQYINNLSKNMTITAKFVGGYEKIHTKGAVADNSALIASTNWNRQSATENREVGVIIHGDAAEYFTEMFMKDWNKNNEKALITGEAAGESSDYLFIVAIISVIIALVLLALKIRSHKYNYV